MPTNPSHPAPPVDSLAVLDQRITRALELAPADSAPADFAARVAADALARFGPLPPASRPAPRRFGPLAIRLACALLLLAMFLAARLSPAATLTQTLEFTLCAEFVALSLYLSLRPSRLP